jgi:hypothetical protein
MVRPSPAPPDAAVGGGPEDDGPAFGWSDEAREKLIRRDDIVGCYCIVLLR